MMRVEHDGKLEYNTKKDSSQTDELMEHVSHCLRRSGENLFLGRMKTGWLLCWR